MFYPPQSELEFKLRRQEFVGMIQQRDLKGAIKYAQTHFPKYSESNFSDIQKAMALLAIKPERLNTLKQYQ